MDPQEIRGILSEAVFSHLGLVETFGDYEEKCTLSEAIFPRALRSCIESMMIVLDALDDDEDNDEKSEDIVEVEDSEL